MATVEGNSATEIVQKTIDFVMENGEDVDAHGGTIPEELGGDGPNDFEREMREYTDGFSFRLSNPRKRWCEFGAKRSHWPGITLRETEDDMFALNPGVTREYSKVYRQWLMDVEKVSGWFWEDDPDIEQEEIYPHTYGERMQKYGRRPGKMNGDFYDQWEGVKKILLEKPSSRKGVMDFWDPEVDLELMHKGPEDDMDAYVPCNITFQIRVVNGKLNWHTFCRSKDTLLGIPENIFTFTTFQELMLLELREAGMDVELGKYVSHISNVHLYGEQIENGYHEQSHPDPYDHYEPTGPSELPWGEVEEQFAHIDDLLREGEYEAVMDEVPEISDDWWRGWKAALAAEWIRMNSEDRDVESMYFALASEVSQPWRIALAKRAVKHFNNPTWAYNEIPEEFKDDIEGWVPS